MDHGHVTGPDRLHGLGREPTIALPVGLGEKREEAVDERAQIARLEFCEQRPRERRPQPQVVVLERGRGAVAVR